MSIDHIVSIDHIENRIVLSKARDLLWGLQWVDTVTDYDETTPICPACGNEQPDNERWGRGQSDWSGEGHEDGCTLRSTIRAIDTMLEHHSKPPQRAV